MLANHAYDLLKQALNLWPYSLTARASSRPPPEGVHSPCERGAVVSHWAARAQGSTEKLRRVVHGAELRALSATGVAPLRRAMEYSVHCSNQGPSPTAVPVGPLYEEFPIFFVARVRKS